jgi:hypothetical protein
MRTDQQLQQICRHLLAGEIGDTALKLDLREFQKLYSFMTEMIGYVPTLSLVRTLGSEVFAQFSDIAPQHFIITHSKPLTLDTFAFVPKMNWHGPRGRPQSFGAFLWNELRLNLRWLGPVLLASAFLLFLANSDTLYDLVATLLIQSGTVFLSIYLIFTVSQSQLISQDKRLFEQGVIHRYHRDDRNVTFLAILTIALTFLNSMVVSVLTKHPATLRFGGVPVDARLWKALSTAVVIVFLFDSFLTVAGYYLERTVDVIERDAIADILDEDFQRHHKGSKGT